MTKIVSRHRQIQLFRCRFNKT